jgi:uncharacterized membrane protein HdeD (DUF308 family)
MTTTPTNPATPTTPVQKPGHSPWIGALLIVLGIIAIALPVVSTIFVETWAALILISAGGAKLAYAFQTRSSGGFIWKLLLSILYVATGIMLFIYPTTGILTLTLLLGSFLLTEGVFELILAFRLRPQNNWLWVLGDGIITLILGAMIWFQWPFNAPWLIGTLVGVSVLFTGISRVMLSFNGQSMNQSGRPDQPASA